MLYLIKILIVTALLYAVVGMAIESKKQGYILSSIIFILIAIITILLSFMFLA